MHGWRLACAWLPWLAAGTIWLNPPAKETDAITSLAAGIVRCASLAAACEWMQSPAVDAKPAAVASDCARARAFEPYCPNERRGVSRVSRGVTVTGNLKFDSTCHDMHSDFLRMPVLPGVAAAGF